MELEPRSQVVAGMALEWRWDIAGANILVGAEMELDEDGLNGAEMALG